MSKKLLTRREVAELLGLQPQTLAKWAMTGKNLSVTKLGPRTARYLYDDVISFISLSTTNGRRHYDTQAGPVEQEQDND
jgi:predicted site-specific integrase-resolvase